MSSLIVEWITHRQARNANIQNNPIEYVCVETNRQQQPCDATAAAHSRTVDHRCVSQNGDQRHSAGVSLALPFFAPGAPAGVVFVSHSEHSERARRIFGASSCLLCALLQCVCSFIQHTLHVSDHYVPRPRCCWNIVYIISLCRCCRVNYIAHAFLCNKAHRALLSLVFMCVRLHVWIRMRFNVKGVNIMLCSRADVDRFFLTLNAYKLFARFSQHTPEAAKRRQKLNFACALN